MMDWWNEGKIGDLNKFLRFYLCMSNKSRTFAA